MKKVFIIMLTMIISASVSAQAPDDSTKTIPMNRTFSVGGKAIMCLRSANAAKRDLKPLEWTLENHPIGDKNYITFRVKNTKTELTEARQSWDNNEQVVMRINAKGEKTYMVYDEIFRHLLVMELSKNNFIILLYSELLNK